MKEKAPSESEVRRLRDAIYGHHSDQGWDACKANWMLPENVQWLREHQPKTEKMHRMALPHSLNDENSK